MSINLKQEPDEAMRSGAGDRVGDDAERSDEEERRW
jgi:hypothetical protein